MQGQVTVAFVPLTAAVIHWCPVPTRDQSAQMYLDQLEEPSILCLLRAH